MTLNIFHYLTKTRGHCWLFFKPYIGQNGCHFSITCLTESDRRRRICTKKIVFFFLFLLDSTWFACYTVITVTILIVFLEKNFSFISRLHFFILLLCWVLNVIVASPRFFFSFCSCQTIFDRVVDHWNY